MSKPPSNKREARDEQARGPRKTRPGLGSASGLPRVESAEMKRADARSSSSKPELEEEKERGSASVRGASAPPAVTPPPRRVRDSIRREDDDEPTPSSGSPSRKPASWRPEAPSGTRAKPRSDRPVVAIDEVGDTAVKLARTRRESAPKLLVSRALIAKAPIDSRAAFVLSLVDGRNTAAAIVDMSGMPEEEVKAILDRLSRLGLIALR